MCACVFWATLVRDLLPVSAKKMQDHLVSLEEIGLFLLLGHRIIHQLTGHITMIGHIFANN